MEEKKKEGSTELGQPFISTMWAKGRFQSRDLLTGRGLDSQMDEAQEGTTGWVGGHKKLGRTSCKGIVECVGNGEHRAGAEEWEQPDT